MLSCMKKSQHTIQTKLQKGFPSWSLLKTPAQLQKLFFPKESAEKTLELSVATADSLMC